MVSTEPNVNQTRALPSLTTIGTLAVIAGEGQLPVDLAKQASAWGLSVIGISLSGSNQKALAQACSRGAVSQGIGEVGKMRRTFQHYGVTHVVFAGKVNKWVLLCRPQLDAEAWSLYQSVRQRNDDTVMLTIINLMASEGYTVLPQTAFLAKHFAAEGFLTVATWAADAPQWADITYGMTHAKASAAQDFGQTVVVQEGMVLAVEAIEGTDACIARAGKLRKARGGVVAKVAKPNQDQRFDVPAVGVRTLNTMHRHGFDTLVTEANETLFLDKPLVIQRAHELGISLISISVDRAQQDPASVLTCNAQALTVSESAPYESVKA